MRAASRFVIPVFAGIAICCAAGFGAEPVNPFDVDGSIVDAVSQPDGKVIIAGYFKRVDQTDHAAIARLNPDGTLDPTFGSTAGPDGEVDAVALQSDGKLLIAGFFTNVGTTSRNRIARLNADGSLDPSFDPGSGFDAAPSQLLLGPGDQVTVGGKFQKFNGITRHGLVRLSSTGALDVAFDPGKNLGPVGGLTFVPYFALQSDGRVIGAGIFQAGNNYDFARLAPDGTIDPGFPGGLSINGVAVQPDGKVLVNGLTPTTYSSRHLYRLNPDGSIDVTFRGGQPFLDAAPVRVELNGRIFVRAPASVQWLDANGNADPLFQPPKLGSGRTSGPSITSAEVLPDGRILISGSFNSVNGTARVGAARLLSNGLLDTSFTPPPTAVGSGRVLNLSTRGAAGQGDAALIGGFIVDGKVPKKVILRGIGPSLNGGSAGIAKPLLDPRITLRDGSGNVLARNDNWRETQIGGLITNDEASEIQASGVPPTDPAESALIVTLAPAAYTVALEGAGATAGTALMEIYDLDGNTAARIANISTRGSVRLNDDVLIGGVILGGNYSTNVLVRAIGPSLTTVAGALADPTLALYNGNGDLVDSNDNWRSGDAQGIQQTQAAPTNDKEAALVRLLAPGNYTAVVRGANSTTGTALVEFYAL